MPNFDFDRNYKSRIDLVAALLSLEDLARSHQQSADYERYDTLIVRIAEMRLDLHFHEAEYHAAIERRVAESCVVPEKSFWKKLFRK